MLAYAPKDGVPTEAELRPHWPLFVSDKLDGIRGVQESSKIISRTWKPLRSSYVQTFVEEWREGFDGELLAPDWPEGSTQFHESQSRCTTIGDQRPVNWFLFDCILRPNDSYEKRLERLMVQGDWHDGRCRLLPQTLIRNYDDLLAYEQVACSERNVEGVIARRPDAPYKYGRATIKEGYLIKFTRWATAEGEIIDFEEQMENTNAAGVDNFGRTKRSTHQAGMRPKGTLGAFVIRDLKTGVVSKVGGGPLLTQKSRAHYWGVRDEIRGSVLHHRFKPYGVKDKPRFAQAYGIRSREDL